MKIPMTVTVMGILAATAVAQHAIYTPVRTLKDQSMNLRAWGSGTISETDELAFEGTYSIRVSTRNFFQGGTILLEKPSDLAADFGDRNNLIRFTIRIADANLTLGGGGGGQGEKQGGGLGGGAGAGQAGGGAGQAGGAAGGQIGGRGGGSGAGGAQAGRSATLNPDATNLKNLRFTFTTSDGKKSEVYVPITTSKVGDRNWLTVAVPLQSITGLDQSNKSVTGISISGDAISTFYVGDIRIVNDSTPISGEMIPNQERNLALGDEIEFRALGFGGGSVLKYSWDFDDKDGVQVDAEGQYIKRRFRVPGNYKVTLTITDVYGLKKAYSTTVQLKVNP